MEKRTYCSEQSIRSYDVEMDGKLLRRNRVRLKPAGKPPTLEKTQSASNPKADVRSVPRKLKV